MTIELRIPAGDQSDLESAVLDELIERCKRNPNFANKNRWGEWEVLQGVALHGVQWSYVGEEVYDEKTGRVIGLDFPDGIDAEIDCSWCIHEDCSEIYFL